MTYEKCRVDLTKSDLYEDGVVPDADVETCLKVLRTVRNLALSPPNFNPKVAVTLSHAHAAIFDLVLLLQRQEAQGDPAQDQQPAAGEARPS